MATNDGGGSAFPYKLNNRQCFGMTLRDYFAAHAPPVPEFIMSEYRRCRAAEWVEFPPWNDGILAEVAYQEARWRRHYADAMLAEIEREVPNAQS